MFLCRPLSSLLLLSLWFKSIDININMISTTSVLGEVKTNTVVFTPIKTRYLDILSLWIDRHYPALNCFFSPYTAQSYMNSISKVIGISPIEHLDNLYEKYEVYRDMFDSDSNFKTSDTNLRLHSGQKANEHCNINSLTLSNSD